MGTIVVGYAPKPGAEATLSHAVAEAKLRGDRLVLVHLHRGNFPYEDDHSRDFQAQLDEAGATLRAAGVEYEIRQRPGMNSAEDILGIAAEVSADLIVIGLRRRSAVGKLLLGSTAQRILLESPCPVLAVRAKS